MTRAGPRHTEAMTEPAPNPDDIAAKLPLRDRRTLHALRWGGDHFGGLLSSRADPLHVIRRLVSKGLAQSVGSVVVCDGDGHAVVPERYRDGWGLTDLGAQVEKAARDRALDEVHAILTARGDRTRPA